MGYDWTVHTRGRGGGGRGGGGRGHRGGGGGGYRGGGRGGRGGGGGRGRGGYGRGGGYDDGGHGSHRGNGRDFAGSGGGTGTSEQLSQMLLRIDGKPYGAYKDLYGTYQYEEGFDLTFDHMQTDPYAPPTRAHVSIQSPGFAQDLFSNHIRRVAVADFLTRAFWDACHRGGVDAGAPASGRGGYGGEKGGAITIDKPGQHVVERSSCVVKADGSVSARFTLAMPARGRSIQGRRADDIITHALPAAVGAALLASGYNDAKKQKLRAHVESVEDQETLRTMLTQEGLVAFVKDAAILPRKTGACDTPLDASTAVAFKSPESLQRTLSLPHCGAITGMAIPVGTTVIVGGRLSRQVDPFEGIGGGRIQQSAWRWSRVCGNREYGRQDPR